MAKTRTRLASDGRHRVCVACHRLLKFCDCPPGAKATCPICGKAADEGKHFPSIDCSGRLVNYTPKED